MKYFKLSVYLGLMLLGTFLVSSAIAGGHELEANLKTEPEQRCAMLDDPAIRPLMSGMFETRLLTECGRSNELGQISSLPENAKSPTILGTDVQVNDSTGETGPTATQSETSLALNENTGTLCSGYNDAYSGVVLGQGYTGFSRSTDGGATFVDGGALGSRSFGDPAVVWRKSDGKFYFGALDSSGLGIWRSDDDCATFVFHAVMHAGSGDDKELMAVDNNVASPFYGRIYNAWTDFSAGANIYLIYSDDGTTWSSPVLLSNSGTSVQGAWPTVAPNGDVYVTWVRWNPYPSGPIDAEVARSTDGGASFSLVANPMTGQVNPRDSAATSSCGRPALNGNMRYLPSPQIAVTPNGNVHIVYSYDPDGFGAGDVVNVYYRRSTDNGATWGPEVQLNDDATLNDQYQPTLSVGPTGRVVTGWYDRRSDGANTLFEYYIRVSDDGGTTWGASSLVSDTPSPIYLDPNLATCYHGDYDTQVQDAGSAYVQWSDDRNIVSSHPDPDVWMDRQVFAPGYFLSADITKGEVCVGDLATFTLNVGSVGNYTGKVRLLANGILTPDRGRAPFSTTYAADTTGMSAGRFWARIRAKGQLPADPLRQRMRVPFNVFDGNPGGTTLVSPADTATGVPTVATLEWNADPNAVSYWVEVSDDPSFTTTVYMEEVEGTTTMVNGLAPNTTYYWRVMSHNPCGSSAWSTVWSFTTANEVCSSPNLAIVDNATVTDSLVFATGDNVGDLDVYLDVSHTWVGDVQFTLTHDDTATSSMFIDRPGYAGSGFGCSGDNYDVTVNDEGGDTAIENQCSNAPAITGDAPGGDPPGNTLDAFDGEAFTGTWTLSVTDNAGGDTGTVNEWCLVNSP